MSEESGTNDRYMSYSPEDNYPSTSNSNSDGMSVLCTIILPHLFALFYSITLSSDLGNENNHTNHHPDEISYKVETSSSSPLGSFINVTRELPKPRKQRVPNSAMDEATLIALRPFKCDECGKRLEKARTLRLHKLSVHEGKLKKNVFQKFDILTFFPE
ncbi:unnamed protein product [Schistosoma margrebowiei]|uniref:Uncharacterized protein n=1 Tax=Schistosoma margrebowiei TaxID=48269 RepID=A0A183N760_9TREM|nr:unnamed protein product [Schistosoma margrebowiei]